MRCPFCNTDESRVIDTRTVGEGIRRRRACQQCHQRFTTYERVARTSLMVVKNDGRREEFDIEKLAMGIKIACAKRPVPTERIEAVVAEIEAALYGLGQTEVPSKLIGEQVMNQIASLDDVAFVRFASVYRRFTDLESLAEEIQKLKQQKERNLAAPKDDLASQ